MRIFLKIKSSRNGEINLSFTDIGKSCPSREFYTSQICLLTPFAKIKFSRKFPDLQYPNLVCMLVQLHLLCHISCALHCVIYFSKHCADSDEKLHSLTIV